MFAKKTLFMVALAAFVGMAMSSVQASVVKQTLGSSGWVAMWDAVPGSDTNVSLLFLSQGGDRVLVEKSATFGKDSIDQGSSSFLPLKITFAQVSRNAKPLVVINDETVVNNTGTAWGGFRFLIHDSTTGTASQSVFNKVATGAFNTAGGFNILPFQSGAYPNDQELVLSNGTVPASGLDRIWRPGGGGALGQLVISAMPTSGSAAMRVFDLKEQPIAIPLPAAAWTGLSGLIGLGLFGAARKIRSLIA